MLPLLGLVGGLLGSGASLAGSSALLGTVSALGSAATAASGLTAAEAALLGAGAGMVLSSSCHDVDDEPDYPQYYQQQPRIVGYRRLPDGSEVPIIQ